MSDKESPISKLCKKCNIEKPLLEIVKDSSRKSGYKNICLECQKKYKYSYYQLNREKCLEKSSEYREQNREKIREWASSYCKINEDIIKQRNRKYYLDNREIVIQKSKDWRKNNLDRERITKFKYREINKESISERQRAYYKQYPEKERERQGRRRARKNEAGTFIISPKDLRRLKNNPCYICGGKSEHIDHIVPLGRGGRHSIGNLVACCAKDNLRKNNLLLVEYLHKRIPLLYQEKNCA